MKLESPITVEKHRDLLRILQVEAYERGEFKLSSGRTSEHYVNCKPVTLHSEGLAPACLIMLVDYIEKDSVAVGGLTLGADPLVSGVVASSYLAYEWGYPKLNDRIAIDGLIVRKEAKGHGTRAYVEGPILPEGSKVTVLEDVITTGGSAIQAANRLRDVGYVVDRVVSIVDRQEEGEADAAMKSAGLELYSLFLLDEVIPRYKDYVIRREREAYFKKYFDDREDVKSFLKKRDPEYYEEIRHELEENDTDE